LGGQDARFLAATIEHTCGPASILEPFASFCILSKIVILSGIVGREESHVFADKLHGSFASLRMTI
jgi:hypothetical protein